MKDLEVLPIITVCPQQSIHEDNLKSLGYKPNWRDILTGKVEFNLKKYY